MKRAASVGPTMAAAVAAGALLAGCSFDGIGELPLPGGTGTGDGAMEVTVELPDVGTLTPNSQVKVGDIAVGTVTEINAVDWHAEAVLSLEPDVELPANAVASVGVNTLLGASYVELAAPHRPQGVLADGAEIPLERGSAHPSTEQVLSAASVTLNGGGLEQLSTITVELNRVLAGNDGAFGDCCRAWTSSWARSTTRRTTSSRPFAISRPSRRSTPGNGG
ncbi:MCE family protein [Nocardioides immobilis]|uniref:MCE family protein n=1 Tax=Nocardioides immobilis TaxID=2049295 RepID=A0A417XZ90_9ACTN|nr:MlaD family protein [Nocardioides immobilis]RHW25677.1 MCE family protein [Nocardioides immobilis]